MTILLATLVRTFGCTVICRVASRQDNQDRILLQLLPLEYTFDRRRNLDHCVVGVDGHGLAVEVDGSLTKSLTRMSKCVT